jgi:hypothetical protein
MATTDMTTRQRRGPAQDAERRAKGMTRTKRDEAAGRNGLNEKGLDDVNSEEYLGSKARDSRRAVKAAKRERESAVMQSLAVEDVIVAQGAHT